MAKKRNRLQIIHDILKVIQEKNGRIKPTHILYKSNLSYQMMEEYMKELIDKGFVIEKKKGNSKTYFLGERGMEYLKKYRFIVDFSDSFGLS